MNPFRTPQETYEASIALDASTVGNTTVTVAVYVTRQQEMEILDSIYEYGRDERIRPFIEKAADYDWSVSSIRQMFENVVSENHSYLRAVSHNADTNGNSDTQQIEAIHSAILVGELLDERRHDRVAGHGTTHQRPKPLVIVDGGKQSLDPFLDALTGVHNGEIAVTHCVKAELYYPQALLADLAANHLAHAIEEGTYSYANPTLPTPVAKREKYDAWTDGITGIKQRRGELDPVEMNQKWGETAQERVCCWYDGVVAPGRNAERPITDSTNRVVQCMAKNGYERLAKRLRRL